MDPDELTIPPAADQDDEALNRWKKSLGLAGGTPLPVAPADKRDCVIPAPAFACAATSAASTRCSAA